MRAPVKTLCSLVAGAALLAGGEPAHAAQAVAYQLDARHTGATSDPDLHAPFVRRWAVDVGQPTSYPVIAGGRVFVVARNASTYGTQLYALDAGDGSLIWRRALGGTYYWAGIAYGDGRLYALNYDGLMVALDPATGLALWSRQLPGQYSFSSDPTYADGVVYTGGAGSGGTLYAVDARTGAVRWTRSVCCGGHSSPAVGDGRVHVRYVCDVYAFSTAGTPIWRHNDGCTGGGGRTTVLDDGRLYARDGAAGTVLDAATGVPLDTFASTTAPAVAGGSAFTIVDRTLHALDTATMTTRWTFSDGGVSIAPLIVNGSVIVGSTTGNVYALERTTGLQRWSDAVGRPIRAPDEHNVAEPVVGLGAGEGLLVVPASGLIVAYAGSSLSPPTDESPPAEGEQPPPEEQQPPPEDGSGTSTGGDATSGGTSGGATPTAGSPAGDAGGGATPLGSGTTAPETRPARGPRLTLAARRTSLLVEERTRVRGRLLGTRRTGRRLVALEVDEWPFGTRFRRVARTRTDRAGRFSFDGAPRSNTRLRARLLGTRLRSRTITLYVDFPARARILDRGGERPRIDFTIWAFPRATVRRGPVHGYLSRSPSEPLRLVATRAWTRRTRRYVRTTLRLPAGTLGRGERWAVCAPERDPDRFGRPTELERRCGEPELPRLAARSLARRAGAAAAGR